MVEHFFRHDYGRLVSMLARRVGVRHIELVEDAVQSALMSALTAWTTQAPPDDPGAWLHEVAYHRLIQDLRQKSGRLKILERAAGDLLDAAGHPEHPFFPDEIRDDMLRMLFVCCDEAIPRDSQLVLALKTLCGFSTAEIALRLFTSEANVHKRLGRARERLRQAPPDLETPPLEILRPRLPSVHKVLYLLFNEGYLSAHAQQAIRRELCDEAVRLATLLTEHPVGAVPESFALLALMHLHGARLGSRVDAMGGLLLLEEQDRSLWDRERVLLGVECLARSAGGDTFSRFHAEAGVAAEHCMAPSYAQTRWHEIADLYAMLERIAPSPLHTLNRGGGGRRMARGRSWSRRTGGARAPRLVSRFLPLGRSTGRPAPPRGTLRRRRATSGTSAGLGSHGCCAGASSASFGAGLERECASRGH